MTQALFVLKSSNRKTGPMPVSYIGRDSCPSSCPHYRTSCYAEGGPARLAWNRAANPWKDYCESVASLPAGTLWRHAVAGDLPGQGSRVNMTELRQLVKANRGKRGFTFTHKKTPGALDAIRWANDEGFTVNLSADNLAEADRLWQTGAGPVVALVPSDAPAKLKTPGGLSVAVCPAQLRDTSCTECQLCSRPGRAVIVGFRAHGPRTRAADALARIPVAVA